MSLTATQRAARLSGWIGTKVREAGSAGALVNLSGGLDSAVVAALIVRGCPGRAQGLILPCESSPKDVEDALTVAAAVGLPVKVVDLTPVYAALLAALQAGGIGPAPGSLAAANSKARLRMISAYAVANLAGYLVVGTGNKAELTVGYFTKYGDGGVDIQPLANLVKGQVRELAVLLGVPQAVLDKPPSAGLWEGQTDEGELGMTYSDLDRYLLGGTVPADVQAAIEARRRASEHKRRLPDAPDFV